MLLCTEEGTLHECTYLHVLVLCTVGRFLVYTVEINTF